MLAPADLVAWWDTAPTQSSSSSLLGDATAPVTDIFGAASQQSMGTKSSTGDNTPIFLLAAALLLIIVGLTVKRRRNSID
jgi:LPXTG-motif cell wall-anchored protein